MPLTTNVMTMMMIAVITLHPVRLLLVLLLHCHRLGLELASCLACLIYAAPSIDTFIFCPRAMDLLW